MTELPEPPVHAVPATDGRPLQVAFEALRRLTSETFVAVARELSERPVSPALLNQFSSAQWVTSDSHPLGWIDPAWHPIVQEAWLVATAAEDRTATATIRTRRSLTSSDGTVEVPMGWFELVLVDLRDVPRMEEMVARFRHLPAGPPQADTAMVDAEALADQLVSDPAWFRGTSNFRLRLGITGRVAGGTMNVAEVLGWPLHDLVGTVLLHLVHPDDVPATQEAWEVLVHASEPQQARCRLRTASGDWRWYEITCWNLIDAPTYGAIIGEFRDIHEQAEAEIEREATSRSLDRLLQMLDQIDDLVIVGRVGGEIMYVNETASSLLGPGDMGRRLLEVLQPDIIDFARSDILPGFLRGEQWVGDLTFPTADNVDPDRIFATTSTPFRDGDEVYYGVIMHDVTDARRQTEVQRTQARQDPLTGMPNRLALMEYLGDLVDHAADGDIVSVCFIDLDNLKVVNDGLGHSAGDQLLKAVGADLLRQPADMAARFGGDEFVVVHVGHESGVAVDVAEKVRLSIGTVRVPGVATHIGASIGVATQVVGDLDPERILRDADAAMYVAKRTGRSRIVHFDASMREVVARRFNLETLLRQALARDQLDLHYQPVVSVATGRVNGFEALTRWPESDPKEFIPVAEESGLIIPLGRWSLTTALRTLSRLDGPGDGLDGRTMAVNVSAHQLFDPEFTGMVLDALQAEQVSPHRLVLELTESILIDPSEEVDVALRKLHDVGVMLALDDFGTGYSSIGYLRRYPISILKLDTGYTQNLDDRSTVIIAEAIVDMALRLGIEVIAEGVETPEQLESIIDMGITSAQGFLLGRAMPAEELPARLQAP